MMFLDTSGAAPAIFHPAVIAAAVPPPFTPWPKIARLSKEVVATEKLDGSSAQVEITDDGRVYAGSRTRWLTPGKQTDNFGFAGWVEENHDDLLELGPGRHYGEWWGKGIQSGYGLQERRFSLFNVGRWRSRHQVQELSHLDPSSVPAPFCCHVVPILYRGPFNSAAIEGVVDELRMFGSSAARGFMKPEGIIVFHAGASVMFKKFLVNDETPKGTLH